MVRFASASEEPQDKAQDDADDERCHKRNVDPQPLPLYHDVTRQPPEAQAFTCQPRQAEGNEHDPEDDEDLRHPYRTRIGSLIDASLR